MKKWIISGLCLMTDGFGIINHEVEHLLDISLKVTLEARQEESVRHLGKAAEIPEFFGKMQEKNEKEIGGDRKNLLKDKSREKPVRDKLAKVEVFGKDLKKGRASSRNISWQSERGIFKRNLVIFNSHKFSPPFASGCLCGYLHFTKSGEKIYIKQVRKSSKINGFLHLTNA